MIQEIDSGQKGYRKSLFMHYFITAPETNSHKDRNGRKSSAAGTLAVFVMIFCFIFSALAQPVQAAVSVTTSDSESTEKNRTTMYVSSALTERRGLCVLLENVDAYGNRKFGLIDTGNANVSAAKAFLNKHGVDSLEFLILTHMHKDHVGNAAWILKNYKVRHLYLKQFDSTWSDGAQYAYESILRAAVTSPHVQQIHGVSYALSLDKSASPKASKSFISFLQANADKRWRFRGLFNSSNTAIYLGSTSLRLYNWEIWAEDGTSQWRPTKNTRCKVQKYAYDRSDNHFSMGVRVTRGNQKIWIGGDMTNLRLDHKRHSSINGDEDRLGRQIGKVDVAILNHHGRGGSNTKSFLKALSPSYVIYTSTRADITGSNSTKAASTLRYLRRTMKLPDSHIIWAFDYWGTHCKDPVVTLDSRPEKKNKSSESTNTSKNGVKNYAASSLTVPLIPGKTYTAYDLTGDGKKDIVSVTGAKSGTEYKGLSISINKNVVWSTKVSFRDTVPVTLLRLPGSQPYICISILTPVGSDGKGNVFGLFKYGKTGSAGSGNGLVLSYNFLKHMPVNNFTYSGAPAISCNAKQITVIARGSDTLSSSAFVSFILKQDKNWLVPVDTFFPYTTVMGKTGTITLDADTSLFSSADADNMSKTLSMGKTVTVTGVVRNKKNVTRYRIIDNGKKVWWINAPAPAAK